jgi:NADPH:quinone reductase-like Zn-dependent oxidoreductase
MRAAVIHNHGELDYLSIENVPEPKPGNNDVVVEVRSAALNHLDIWVRKGRPGVELSMPHILGSDAAGVVVDTGPSTNNILNCFGIGDEVIINPGLSCGCCEFCQRGQQSECLSFGIVGMARPGTFAEKVAVPFYNLWPKPQHLDFYEAAALPLAYQTAWRMLITRAEIKPGQTVLIHGIGGGVALAALQFAGMVGACVIVTSSSDEKLKRASALGADYTINYKTTKNLVDAVIDKNKGRRVDVVIDTVGAATWDVDFSVVRRGGKIVLCGVTSGATAETNLQKLYWNQLTVLGSTMGSNEDLQQMLKAVETNRIKPVIDSVEPLENIKEAMGKMEKGEQFGKIVLNID